VSAHTQVGETAEKMRKLLTNALSLLCAPLAPFALLYCALRHEWGCEASRISVLLHTILFASLHILVTVLSNASRVEWLDRLLSPISSRVFAAYVTLLVVVTCKAAYASLSHS
jgi:surface polysaccharide O-acyltransferase-like enzyme